MNNQVILGRFGSTYGVRGWIRVFSFTDPTENILNYPHWKTQIAGPWKEIVIEDSKTMAKSIVVKIAGCETPEASRQYTNQLIAVDRQLLPSLTNEEYYWADLIGLKVITLTGIELGIVDQLLETGANDVLIVKGLRQRLIPFISQTINTVDMVNKIIIVDWDPDF